ncbi:tetratricopeptide repeat protein [Aureimonas leprariae]|uniref:Sel1 repeat family protein n=1 Tax=Plantimonas leprariae TaxID=2615207 RepID=A0A7V7U1J0_9HYPH|nr:tetratricopeptide repeat protein [Aureimonas leprariae]KAB0681992.1 sel1 repeat family protein [Aureimonas leprariae]
MADSSVFFRAGPAHAGRGDASYEGAQTLLPAPASRGRLKSLATVAALAIAVFFGGAADEALALDPNSMLSPDSAPSDLFNLGFNAYKRGEKTEAAEALRYAAEKGHPGARWKLGRMYADGDGVPKDDYEAFKIFQDIVADDQDDTSTSPNAAYVASSVTALADYMRTGIPDTPVRIDLPQARQLYFHAASVFGSAQAQFQLGRMLLTGEGGRANPRQAARWLNLAAEKGNVQAQALLGHLLFDGEQIAIDPEPARGLALLTMALRKAPASDREWIRPMQEEAFSLASEGDRRTALALVASQAVPIARN